MKIKQDRINKRYRTQLGLINLDYQTGEPLKALQLLLSVFDTSLSLASKLASQHELSNEMLKQLERELQAIYTTLIMATASTGLNFKDGLPELADHPLTALWKQWKKQKEEVTRIAEWFMQK